ncbi:MAG: hypothetical protein H6868_02170 [Rhodospirillales bacterium]|nr:hypothetical protein [Rhodospirillales bacterium]
MKILVLTDTRSYGPQATLYPLLRGLCARAEVTAVYIADRAILGNEYFYEARDPGIGFVYARRADSDYRFETQETYPATLIPLAGVDAVWMRLDLADELFSQYVETRFSGRFISNNPAGMVRAGTKAFLLSLQPMMEELMPPIALCYGADNVMSFRETCPDMVLKVLSSFGGQGVKRFRSHGETDLKDEADVERFLSENGPCLAMAYLDNPRQSDNRLVVLNGEILGAICRTPPPGGWICNLMAGGSCVAAEPDAREIEIVRRIDPLMRALGVHYYGVDTLLDSQNRRVLSEINTVNAGGAYRYELATGVPVCQRIADAFVDYARAFVPAQLLDKVEENPILN